MGIYLVLFCICIYILLSRPCNLANIILLGTAIAFFTLATVQIVIHLVLGAGEIDNLDIPYGQLFGASDVVYTISNFIADGLVIYRCYSVWNKSALVTILPILLLIASTVLGLTESFDFNLSIDPLFAVSLATNVLVAMLTGTWANLVDLPLFPRVLEACGKSTIRICYGNAVRVLCSSLKPSYPFSRRIESGMLYSATVLAYLVVLSIPSASILGEPIFAMLVQIMGIPPTLIIVRAGLAVKIKDLKPMEDSLPPRKRRIF
ncbi:hypothetical protein MSAN_01643100 [Mycena sanguinolenta]|uniref:Uncharacterized protein n=1 Tax=Mycena sanguinolenta TaxID=230812 RepID=A0A8H7CUJ5_9AGAR|nr:hypothetical protein MSAN_01643100 [Mycena sanguinolenta]